MAPASQVEPTLPDIIRKAARHSSDGFLACVASSGLLALVASVIWRPPALIPIACLSTLLLSFGAYGIADRELALPLRTLSKAARRTLTGLRSSAFILGACSAFALFLTVLAKLLGTWIS